MTTVFGAAVAGITKRVGLFDDNNGLFYEMAPTGMQLIVRTSTSGAPVDTAITQANWNIDKMDGTGVSGVTLDFTKSQILFFDFSWLGVGISRYGWVVDGKTFYCHEVRNTNNLALVYMSMPNLPFRYEISNSGAGGAASLLHICTTIISEGGVQANGFSFGLTRGSTPITTNNNASIYPLISLRLKSTHIGSTVRVKNISIACSSTSTYVWYLILNPTVVGTALAWTGVTNSSIEANLVSTNATTLTGGTILASGVSQQTNDGGVNIMSPNDHALGSSISGTRDIIVLAVQRVTGTSETFYGSLNIKDEN